MEVKQDARIQMQKRKLDGRIECKFTNSIELAKMEARAAMQKRAELAARRIENTIQIKHVKHNLFVFATYVFATCVFASCVFAIWAFYKN